MTPRSDGQPVGPALGRLLVYLVAVASVAAVAAARFLLTPVLLDYSPFLLFTLAVAVSGYVGGFRPALLATAIGAVAGAGLFQPWDTNPPAVEAARLVLFVAVGVAIGGLSGILQAHRRAAEAEVGRRRAAEAELARSKQLLERVAGATPGLLYVYDLRARRTVYCNHRVTDLLGYTPEQLAAGPDRAGEPLHPDDRAAAAAGANQYDALPDGAVVEHDLRWRAADGTYRVLRSRHLVFERAADGRPATILGLAQDVTAEVQAADHLRASEARFHTLADAMPQIVYVTAADGTQEFLNRRWQEYTGRTTCTPDDLAALVPADDRAEVARRWEAAQRAGRELAAELRIRGADGVERWFLTRAVPVRGADGRIERWFGTSTDIHAQKQAEQALRDADRRKDEFLAVLGHELRNPLGSIRNAVEVLRAVRLGDPAAARQRDVIDRQARHLARLVDDLLDVSRITHGKVRVRMAPFDLRAAVSQGVETARPLIEARRHRLTVAVPPDPVPVDGDADRLAQVTANLLNNAAKYTPDGGDVAVTVAAAGGWAEVRVRDTGAGFTPDQLAAVFAPFAQLAHSLDRSHGGLGVGLALVRTLVELHGGAVEARSDGPGRGAEFVVRLPVTAAPLPAAAPPPPAARAGRRVLVVDDNIDAADSLSFLLEMFGHQVRAAHDGPSGVAAAAEFRPDVAFLDLGMPGMDGYAVAARLRGDPGCAGVTLVALTGWGQDDDRRRTREAGFDHHLVKPVNPDDLRQLLAGGPTACRV